MKPDHDFATKIPLINRGVAVLFSSIFLLLSLSAPVWAQCPGCCSSHGGITQSCAANGNVMCADGTPSPTCSCSSCGVSTTRYRLSVSRTGLGFGAVTSSPFGINCGNTCSTTYTSGTRVALAATPNSGSTFGGWSGSCSGTSSCSVTMSGTRNVTASFNAPVTPTTFVLNVSVGGTGSGSVTSNPSGINCGDTCTSNFNSGTLVTLTATPNSFSTFEGWSGSCSGTTGCVVSMSAARSATANFSTPLVPIVFPLTVTVGGTGTGTVLSNPAGIQCGSTCVASFQLGASVTLSATAANGSQFMGWGGDCSGTAVCTVSINGARNVSAVFAGTESSGIQPEAGLWWNAAEPGRGFNIEVQNSFLYFAGYLYNADGTAQWYVAQGDYSHAQRRFEGALLAFVGGQCMTCPFQRNRPAESPGNLTLIFSSMSSGTLVWPGGQIPITRVRFGDQDVRQLLGSWVFSSDIGTIAAGHWIKFTSYQTNSATVSGANAGDRTVVGSIQGSTLSVLVDASPSTYDLYMFPLDAAGITSLGDGRYWQYPKTGNPSGLGTPAKALKYGPAPITNAPDLAIAKSDAAMAADLRRAVETLIEQLPGGTSE